MRLVLVVAMAAALAGCEGFAEMKQPVQGYSVNCDSTAAKSEGRGYNPCLANQAFPSTVFSFDFENLFSSGPENKAPPPPGTQ